MMELDDAGPAAGHPANSSEATVPWSRRASG
jgi:hypothetical protein